MKVELKRINLKSGLYNSRKGLIGIALFSSVLVVNTAQADTNIKHEDLEIFYKQVFGELPPKNGTVENLAKKSDVIKTTTKDPELVAFYHQVFGKQKKSKVKNKKLSIRRTIKVKHHNKRSQTKLASKKILSQKSLTNNLVATVQLQKLINELKNDNQKIETKPSIIKKNATVKYSYNKSIDVRKPKSQTAQKHHVKKTKAVNISKSQKLAQKEFKPKKWPTKTNTETKAERLQKLINTQKQSDHRASREIKTKNVSISSKNNFNSAQKGLNNNSQNELKTKEQVESKPAKLQKLIDDLHQPNDISLGNSQTKKKPNKKIVKQIEKQNTPRDSDFSPKSEAKDLTALFTKAFGKKAAKGPPEVTVDFRVNKSTVGEIKLFSNSSGIIELADAKQLTGLLKDVIKDDVFIDFKKLTDNKNKIPISKLEIVKVSATYNSTNLSLDLNIPPELRKPLVISMINRKGATVRPENKIKAQDISSFLNVYTDVGFNSENSDSDFKMKLEGSLNLKGKVLESTLDYRNEKFTSSKTTLTYDRPDNLHRFVIGNISTGNRNFQENIELDGFRVSKEFFMNPELKIRPRANETINLETDSEVEVYINNRLYQRFYLSEGVYSLEDIGLYDGANNIQVRIKDSFGKITVKSSEQFYDSHLLKSGLSLFALSVGYLSNKDLYTNDLLHDKPILSGYYQKGLHKDLTLSLDAQFTPDSYLLGAESITSIKIGTIKNSIAFSGGSYDRAKTGFATSFEFKPIKKIEKFSLDTLRQDMLRLAPQNKGFVTSWTLSGEYRSEDFSLLNGASEQQLTSNPVDTLSIIDQKLKFNLQSNFNLRLNEYWNGYLNVGMSDYYDADQSYYVNLSTSRRLNNGVRLSLGARYDTEDDFSMNLQLSVPLSREKGRRKKDFDLLVSSKNQLVESKLSIKPTSNIGRNSLAAYLEHHQNDNSKYQNLDVQYRHPNFETSFNARNRINKSKNDQEFHIGLNTGVACVGLDCAATLPIQDSFALVSGPSNQKDPIAINNNGSRFKYSDGNLTALPDNYTALIPAKGRKAVVNLESFRSQNINIAESTLPRGYDSEKTEFEVFPRYHEGFLIKAGGKPATILDGILVDRNNKPLGFKGGQWVPENEQGKVIAFFSNKAGRFRVTSIPPGKYSLELFDYPDMQNINIKVPDLKGEVHEIGNILINQ